MSRGDHKRFETRQEKLSMLTLNGWFELDKKMHFSFWFKWNLKTHDKMALEIANLGTN